MFYSPKGGHGSNCPRCVLSFECRHKHMTTSTHKNQQTRRYVKKKPHRKLGDHKYWVCDRDSHSSHPFATQRTSHLDPPEKGRKEWLCREDPGANREGSNTCRESQDKVGSSPYFPAMGEHDTKSGNRKGGGPGRSSPSLPVGPHTSGFGHTFGLWWRP